MSQTIVLPRGRGDNRLRGLVRFATQLINLSNQIGFKLSARGWCYQLEGFRLINKDQFSRVEDMINECRKLGALPINFTAEEESRKFGGVETPNEESPEKYLKRFLVGALRCENWYAPDWWDGEKYYIQMIVEKIDLKTLFEPICSEYHIPIATTKGWSSMIQRAEYARRFKQAEDKKLKCVLLYCGDHDPDGLRISDFLRSNLIDLAYVKWMDGVEGYNPRELKIDRFGLNYDFITENDLTWIDNLITGSGKDLGSPSHPNFYMEYVQEYLQKIGERKCEANALVVRPGQARQLCREAIEKYVGPDALARTQAKRQKIVDELEEFRDRTGLDNTIKEAIKTIDEAE